LEPWKPKSIEADLTLYAPPPALGLQRYIEMLVRLLPPGPADRRRATAITALSTLVGAVSMARAVNDEALSREILASAALHLKAQLR